MTSIYMGRETGRNRKNNHVQLFTINMEVTHYLISPREKERDSNRSSTEYSVVFIK